MVKMVSPRHMAADITVRGQVNVDKMTTPAFWHKCMLTSRAVPDRSMLTPRAVRINASYINYCLGEGSDDNKRLPGQMHYKINRCQGH